MVQHRPSVSLVVLDGDDLIVVRQRRPGSDRELLELPAGTLEPDEDPREAADRELAEECGVTVSSCTEVGSFWAAPAYSTEHVTVLAGICSGHAHGHPDPDEQITVDRLPLPLALGRLDDATSIAALALWQPTCL